MLVPVVGCMLPCWPANVKLKWLKVSSPQKVALIILRGIFLFEAVKSEYKPACQSLASLWHLNFVFVGHDDTNPVGEWATPASRNDNLLVSIVEGLRPRAGVRLGMMTLLSQA